MMRVRVRYDSWIAKLAGALAITLYPFIFVAAPAEPKPVGTLRHELVHVRQVRALGWWTFYARYVWAFLRVFVRTWSYALAYMAIPYEREAYDTSEKITPTDAEREELGL